MCYFVVYELKSAIPKKDVMTYGEVTGSYHPVVKMEAVDRTLNEDLIFSTGSISF